ncbi:hypothetical protein N7509_009274 [Penicillium cosmopolitanum]|uniref:BZIP transcription factor n=1 Tax=Penicillium cosmopolitanum TaxID=1131564 RepID=A0A9X0B3F7_9EURO|nr:uncharacterized protein N7509_009274 [Penicillium cosmopolitanum]KAJ5386733.1 hypothetical protein N7509_009274 [Penicillium cosmopolitanum]
MSDTEMNEASPVPTLPQPNDGGRMHMSSLSSSSSISDAETERRGRSELPRDHPEIEIEEEEFPPDDARAMSPRRNSADLERLGKEARQTLQEQAKALQSSLQAIAERIDVVKSDHDKLENENKILQDYIGGLTRNMTKTEMSRSTKARKAQK